MQSGELFRRAGCFLLAAHMFVSAAVVHSAPVEAAAATRAKELVQRLADPSFAIRKQAATDLIAMGRAAESALRAGLTDRDPEVRQRCGELLEAVLHNDREARLKAFVEDKGGVSAASPAGWARFAHFAGNTPAARTAFAALYEADADLLEMLERTPADVAARVGDRANRLPGLCIVPDHEKEAIAEATLLLFLTTQEGITAPLAGRDAVMTGLEVIANRPALLKEYLAAPGTRPLTVQFLRQAPNPASLERSVALAGALGLKEAIDWALDLAAGAKQPAAVRAAALVSVGQVGSKEHLPRIEPLLKDTTAVGTRSLGKTTLRAELRDLALAASIQLSGRKVTDFGFPYLEAIPGLASVPAPACLGFADAASRDTAFRKWAEKSGRKP